MPTKRTLRAVPDGSDGAEKASGYRATRSVSEAAKSGTTRELLEATRDRIAQAVEDPKTPARDLAALTKRLMETVREIEAIDARELQEGRSGAKVEDGKFDAAAI